MQVQSCSRLGCPRVHIAAQLQIDPLFKGAHSSTQLWIPAQKTTVSITLPSCLLGQHYRMGSMFALLNLVTCYVVFLSVVPYLQREPNLVNKQPRR